MLVIPESERVKRSINDPRIRVDVRAHVYRLKRIRVNVADVAVDCSLNPGGTQV